MKPAQHFVSATAMLSVLLSLVSAADIPLPAWKHLSSRNGDLPVPNGGTQQTSCITFDIDGDGHLDLVSIAYFGFKDLHLWRNDNGKK